MEILEERRKIEQIPVYDKDGRIDYYKIPNYKLRSEFMTISERAFMRCLISVIKKLNSESKDNRVFLQVSTQVALNRIIDINNKRIPSSYDEIKNKSIDYVIYDLNSGKIICCIELDGREHAENEERKNRDIVISKMLNGVVKIIHIRMKSSYNEDEIIKLIKE